MHIVFHHDRALPVAEYGGTERLIYWLMKDLTRLGHNVSFIGPAQSNFAGTSIRLIPWNPKDPQESPWWKKIPSDADLVHLFCNQTLPVPIPTLSTIGGNGRYGELFSHNTVFVSRKHAQNHNSSSFVYNSIDFDEYPESDVISAQQLSAWNHFLFLAKANWSVKNLRGTARACRNQHKHLHICGGRSYWPSRYVHSHGMVGGAKKLEIMKSCSALLFPVRWDEPFGLAMVEAMALGLPVIGSPYGSIPELLSQDRDSPTSPPVGLIVKNEAELRTALSSTPNNEKIDILTKLKPIEIREYAKRHFSVRRMTLDYVSLYQKLARGEKLQQHSPSWCLYRHPEDLLPF